MPIRVEPHPSRKSELNVILESVFNRPCIVTRSGSAWERSDFLEQVPRPCEGNLRILQDSHIISIKWHFYLANTDEKVTQGLTLSLHGNSSFKTISYISVVFSNIVDSHTRAREWYRGFAVPIGNG